MSDLIRELVNQIMNNAPTIVFIIAVVYTSSLIDATMNENSLYNEILSLVILCICAAPLLKELSYVAVSAHDAIDEVQVVLSGAIPAMTTMNIGNDNVGNIIFYLLTEVIIVLINKIFFPLVLIYVALSVCAAISDKFNVIGIKNGVKNFFSWGLGIIMIAFSIISSFSGALSGAKQTMLGRSLKYTGSMVPVVGRYLSESADMTFASINVMKSTVGIGATTALVSSIAIPVIKITAYIVLYRICSALIKPVEGKRITQLTDAVADAFTMIAGIVILVGIMAVMNISMLVKITVA